MNSVLDEYQFQIYQFYPKSFVIPIRVYENMISLRSTNLLVIFFIIVNIR